MTAADTKELSLVRQAKEIHSVYQMNGLSQPVKLFAEDYDFLDKRGAISSTGDLAGSGAKVVRGPHRKKPKKKRPPQAQI